MYQILWEYEVRTDHLADFQTLYSPQGAWAQLFGRAAGFLRTDLFCNTTRPTHFLTLDSWQSRAAHEEFLASTGAEYAALDEQGAKLTLSERRLGAFGNGDTID